MARRYTKRRTHTKRRKGGAKWWKSIRFPWTKRPNAESSWNKWTFSRKAAPVVSAPVVESVDEAEEKINTKIQQEKQLQAELNKQIMSNTNHFQSNLIIEHSDSIERLSALNKLKNEYINEKIESFQLEEQINELYSLNEPSN